jgi:hypothetical protein
MQIQFFSLSLPAPCQQSWQRGDRQELAWVFSFAERGVHTHVFWQKTTNPLKYDSMHIYKYIYITIYNEVGSGCGCFGARLDATDKEETHELELLGG